MSVDGLGWPGVRTDRFGDAEAARARLEAAGVELLTKIERSARAARCHFREPDGNVYELVSGGRTGR